MEAFGILASKLVPSSEPAYSNIPTTILQVSPLINLFHAFAIFRKLNIMRYFFPREYLIISAPDLVPL